MANSVANHSLSGASSGSPFAIFSGPVNCSTYAVRNRDAAIAVRVLVSSLHSAGEDGAVVGPGETQLFHGGGNSISSVKVWPESGTPSVDGFVAARD